MEIFDIVLKKPANESIYKQNINPLRVGLTMYKLIDDIQHEFNYSSFSSATMKSIITDHIAATLTRLNEPDINQRLIGKHHGVTRHPKLFC